jgi:thiol-disulfide isomerase/thioredoxin
MRRTITVVILCILVGTALFKFTAGLSMQTPGLKAPEFNHAAAVDWLNSAPLKLAGLQGKTVLVEFWAFDCINCRRSIPWLHSLQQKYSARDFLIVGVHTPELPEERATANVRAAIEQLHITYPVMIDADYSYWNALNNQYWPAFYLIGADGHIAAQEIGEIHIGETRAREFEKQIAAAIKIALRGQL